jgi:hypothetical protein
LQATAVDTAWCRLTATREPNRIHEVLAPIRALLVAGRLDWPIASSHQLKSLAPRRFFDESRY